MEAAQRLTERSRPQVFIAEPVGSCTDLVASVAYPLRRLHGENFTMAPVSVLVDPIRALRVFGVEEGGSFSEKVLYSLTGTTFCGSWRARSSSACKQARPRWRI